MGAKETSFGCGTLNILTLISRKRIFSVFLLSLTLSSWLPALSRISLTSPTPSLSNVSLVDALASWNSLLNPPVVFAKCPFLISEKFGNVIVCAIERDHQIIIPSGDMTIQDKDRILSLVTVFDMMLFHNYFKSRAVKSLLIVGAGRIAYYLLGILKDSRIDTKVIEINPEIASFFSEKFPNLYIVQGDGTAKDILLEESAQNYDAVATLTGVDEENLITSMFLDRVGVQKNITKVNRYQSPRNYQCA